MNGSISQTAYSGLGHCTVCGVWTHLEMWDNGLNGRFCLKCFDYVVHAKDLLRSQALRKLKKSCKVFAEYEIHRCITLMV